MNLSGKNLLWLLAIGITTSANGAANDRYNTIADRNIFRLTSPPPPPPVTNINEALDRNVEFSGISTVNGQKKAWFIVKPKAAKDAPMYLSIGENERQDFLEVVSISEENGEVKVVNGGASMILSFKNNLPKGGPLAPVSGVPLPAVVGGSPVPSQLPVTSYPVNTGNAGKLNAGRAVTVTGGPATLPSGTAQPENTLRTIPTRQVRLSPISGNPPPAAPQEGPVDPVAQRAMMEIQQEQARQTGKTIPPLPPLPQ